MHSDHLLLFHQEQQAREVGRRGQPDAQPRIRIRERAGDHLISIGMRLRGRPPDPWPQPLHG